mgnify:CR=1 FL=1
MTADDFETQKDSVRDAIAAAAGVTADDVTNLVASVARRRSRSLLQAMGRDPHSISPYAAAPPTRIWSISGPQI